MKHWFFLYGVAAFTLACTAALSACEDNPADTRAKPIEEKQSIGKSRMAVRERVAADRNYTMTLWEDTQEGVLCYQVRRDDSVALSCVPKTAPATSCPLPEKTDAPAP